jgi:hypothetical protein
MLKSNDIALQIYGLSKYLNGMFKLSIFLSWTWIIFYIDIDIDIGVTIIRKGEYDMICSGEDLYIIMEKGSPRRCGGQVTSFSVFTFVQS